MSSQNGYDSQQPQPQRTGVCMLTFLFILSQLLSAEKKRLTELLMQVKMSPKWDGMFSEKINSSSVLMPSQSCAVSSRMTVSKFL